MKVEAHCSPAVEERKQTRRSHRLGRRRALAGLHEQRGSQGTEVTFLQGYGHLSLEMRL